MTAVPKERITSAEYLQLPESNVPMELIDGVIYEMPSPLLEHQRSLRKFYNVLSPLTKEGEWLFAPMDVQLDELNVVQPDLFWIAPDSLCQSPDGRHLVGAPDLVIEVLSESTNRRDKREKYRLYEKYGTREYWLVNPLEQSIEVYVRQNEAFVRHGIYFVEDTFESPLLSKSIVVAEIFASA
jgi:Uma2 family endonuclease